MSWSALRIAAVTLVASWAGVAQAQFEVSIRELSGYPIDVATRCSIGAVWALIENPEHGLGVEEATQGQPPKWLGVPAGRGGAISCRDGGHVWYVAETLVGFLGDDGELHSFRLGSPGAGVAATVQGDAWISLPELDAVVRLSPGGTIAELIEFERASRPTALEIGTGGRLWVSLVGRTSILRLDGVERQEFVVKEGVLQMTEWVEGGLVCALPERGALGLLAPNGATYYSPVSSPGVGPVGVDRGPDGSLWYTEPGDGRVHREGQDGSVRVATIEGFPSLIGVDGDGAAWVPLFTEATIARLVPLPLAVCPADCSPYDGRVDVNEVVVCVASVIDDMHRFQCSKCDVDGDGSIGIGDLVATVGVLLDGCS